jgi:hypothetical protein
MPVSVGEMAWSKYLCLKYDVATALITIVD